MKYLNLKYIRVFLNWFFYRNVDKKILLYKPLVFEYFRKFTYFSPQLEQGEIQENKNTICHNLDLNNDESKTKLLIYIIARLLEKKLEQIIPKDFIQKFEYQKSVECLRERKEYKLNKQEIFREYVYICILSQDDVMLRLALNGMKQNL